MPFSEKRRIPHTRRHTRIATYLIGDLVVLTRRHQSVDEEPQSAYNDEVLQQVHPDFGVTVFRRLVSDFSVPTTTDGKKFFPPISPSARTLLHFLCFSVQFDRFLHIVNRIGCSVV